MGCGLAGASDPFPANSKRSPISCGDCRRSWSAIESSARLLHRKGSCSVCRTSSPEISHGRMHRGGESAKIVVQQRFIADSQSAPMPTECSADLFGFPAVEGRDVVAAFDGGSITSDAGALLL